MELSVIIKRLGTSKATRIKHGLLPKAVVALRHDQQKNGSADRVLPGRLISYRRPLPNVESVFSFALRFVEQVDGFEVLAFEHFEACSAASADV
ncbi:MAG: hypothetical protein ACI8P0_006101 [Planctomycetaceae bacterium]|jgi:hypothetical protein